MGGDIEPDEIIYNFRFDSETQEELAEIVEYYSSHPNPDNGKRFLAKVETVTDLLRMWPEVGSALEDVEGVRSFPIPKYPYRLYYTIFRDEIEIIGIAIYHTKRDFEAFLPPRATAFTPPHTTKQQKNHSSARPRLALSLRGAEQRRNPLRAWPRLTVSLRAKRSNPPSARQ
jgi:plasmid stabilization system protein ParE